MPAHPPRVGAGADSLELSAFIKRLQGVFSNEQIHDIISKLPAKCKIYGFDTGDFSGDTLKDIAISARVPLSPKRELAVFFFLNTATGFQLAMRTTRGYVNDPIEIGFSIDGGMCLVTSKLRELHWLIEGYTLEDRVFRKVYAWETRKITPQLGYETQCDYRTWRTQETFYRIADAKFLARNRFITLPVLRTTARPGPELTRLVGDTSAGAVLRGSSSWFGPDDCAMTLEADYDDSMMTIAVDLRDERILTRNDTAEADRLELWFDTGGWRYAPDRHPAASGGTFAVVMDWRDGGRGPALESRITTEIDQSRELRPMLEAIRCAEVASDGGRHRIMCTLPIGLFDTTAGTIANGFTAAYFDHDNPDHPDWETVFATSEKFTRGDPVTFGAMMFLGDAAMFERVDLRLREIIDRLARAGAIE